MAVWLEIKEMDMAVRGRWRMMWGAFRGICVEQTKLRVLTEIRTQNSFEGT
jgi:hypothetical protein